NAAIGRTCAATPSQDGSGARNRLACATTARLAPAAPGRATLPGIACGAFRSTSGRQMRVSAPRWRRQMSAPDRWERTLLTLGQVDRRSGTLPARSQCQGDTAEPGLA